MTKTIQEKIDELQLDSSEKRTKIYAYEREISDKKRKIKEMKDEIDANYNQIKMLSSMYIRIAKENIIKNTKNGKQ